MSKPEKTRWKEPTHEDLSLPLPHEIEQRAIPLAGNDGTHKQNSSQALVFSLASRLVSDQSQGEPSCTDGDIAEALSISRRTVIRIKQRFVQGNLEVALIGSFPRERPERRCLDGKEEAQLVWLACGKAPDGRQRWTLELLAA